MNTLKHLMSMSVFTFGWLLGLSGGRAQAEYNVERVVGGLNQPMFVTQAPGDSSSLYIVERNDGSGQLGRIRNYNLQTQTFSTFLDLSGTIVSDGGLLSMTFHPEFQSNGLFYVVSNSNGTNGLDEYKVVSGTAQLQRRLLQYQNLDNVYHTLNQAHFRPNGNNNELFVISGDGGTQADDPDHDTPLIESPDSPFGKLMRFDLAADFSTPADGPTHAGVDLVALGLRNPYRSGFDRQTGDFYMGDVGFNTAEEVDFIPASQFANPAAPVLDFGWTDREGTVATVAPYAGGPGSPGDVNPIFDYAHSGQPLPHTSLITGLSITGGYVYRGPVSELQGRYFFSDFVNGKVYSGSFDTNTNVLNYDGTNLTDLQDHTLTYESLIGGGADIRNVTSFGEDNAGNLYIVKFGNGFFPALGQGELFRVVPVPSETIEVTIDRNTGAVALANSTGSGVAFTSLTISSPSGAIDAASLTPITGHYDVNGNGAIDSNNAWSITSSADNHMLFSESTTGDSGTLGNGTQLTFSPAGGWLQSPEEDWLVSVLLSNGTTLAAEVQYSGNGGQPFERSDLDFDGTINAADWSVFLAHSYENLAGLSPAQAYAQGDLDGDGDNDYGDFQLFKNDFNGTNGTGAFEAMLNSVPEPGSIVLFAVGAVAASVGSRLQSLRCHGKSPRDKAKGIGRVVTC